MQHTTRQWAYSIKLEFMTVQILVHCISLVTSLKMHDAELSVTECSSMHTLTRLEVPTAMLLKIQLLVDMTSCNWVCNDL
jgi:hypothetical protein